MPLRAAQDYQRAVAKDMRQQQQQHRNSVQEDAAEPNIEINMDLHLRNCAREDEACMSDFPARQGLAMVVFSLRISARATFL